MVLSKSPDLYPLFYHNQITDVIAVLNRHILLDEVSTMHNVVHSNMLFPWIALSQYNPFDTWHAADSVSFKQLYKKLKYWGVMVKAQSLSGRLLSGETVWDDAKLFNIAGCINWGLVYDECFQPMFPL